MLNLAMLAILNRQHELRGHVRGAINNGVTKEEIREIFLHVGLYAGAPIDARLGARREGSDRRDGEAVTQPCSLSLQSGERDRGVRQSYDSACFTRSGENGTRRMRTPVASKIALAIAAATGRIEGSPAPLGGSSG